MANVLDERLTPRKATQEFVRLLHQQKRMHDPFRAAVPPSVLVSDLYAAIERFDCSTLPAAQNSAEQRMSPLDVAGRVCHPCDKDVLQCDDGTVLIHDLSVLNGEFFVDLGSHQRGPCGTLCEGAPPVWDDSAGAAVTGAAGTGAASSNSLHSACAPPAGLVDRVVLFVGPVGHVQAVVLDLRLAVHGSVILADAFDADGRHVSTVIKRAVQERVRRPISWLDVNPSNLQRQRSGAQTLLCAHLGIVYAWLRLVDDLSPLDALAVLEHARLRQDEGAVPFGALISRVREGRRLTLAGPSPPPTLLLRFRTVGALEAAAVAEVLEADHQCWEICNRCYTKWTAEDLARWSERGEGREVVIALAPSVLLGGKEEAAGYVLLEHRADSVFVFFLCCTEAWKRRGVGRACLRFVFSVARAAGHGRVDLCVHARNKPAVALYESEGFSRGPARTGGLRLYSRVVGEL